MVWDTTISGSGQSRGELDRISLLILSILHVGILKLELSKESYERAGLVGKAIRDGARKHVKTRYG